MAAWLVNMGRRDEALLHALVLRRRSWLDRLLRRLTHLGDAVTTVPLAALLLEVSPRGVGGRAAWALLASHLAAQAVKRSVNRSRPHLPAGVESLVRAPDRFSFPSGHAAATMSIAIPAAWSLPLVLGGGVVGLALLIGMSRAYLGVHYPGDVLAGWALAAAGAATAPVVVSLLSGLP